MGDRRRPRDAAAQAAAWHDAGARARDEAARAFEGAAAQLHTVSGHLSGVLVPARARVGGWLAVVGFLGLHALVAWAVTPRSDAGLLAWAFSFVVPAVLAFRVYWHGRVIASPGTPLIRRGPSVRPPLHAAPPTLFYRSRRAALGLLTVCLVLDGARLAFALPAMVRDAQGPRSPTPSTPSTPSTSR